MSTNEENVCNDPAYLNSIDQKRRFQLLNIPPVRYDNLATNPYIKKGVTGLYYTKADLDMRRKVEILKYSANRMSTQTNSLTKAERYAQAVRGKLQQRTYSNSYLQQNVVNGQLIACPPVQTSTTASDVPGPPIYLYEDDTVPLYNFNKDSNDVYGIQNQALNPYPIQWDYIRLSNILTTTDYATFTSIYIVNTDSPKYIFSIQTPISFVLSGKLQQGVVGPYIDSAAMSISIRSITLNVKYSYSNVLLVPAPTIIYGTGQTIDVSMNMINTSTFSANCYLGLLQINNLQLPTQHGNIYDIQAKITYQILYPSSRYPNYCDPPQITSYLDVSLNQVSPIYQTNCSITGRTPFNPVNFPVLTVSGAPYFV